MQIENVNNSKTNLQANKAPHFMKLLINNQKKN